MQTLMSELSVFTMYLPLGSEQGWTPGRKIPESDELSRVSRAMGDAGGRCPLGWIIMKMAIGSSGGVQEDARGPFCSLISQYFFWVPKIVAFHKFSRILGKQLLPFSSTPGGSLSSGWRGGEREGETWVSRLLGSFRSVCLP